MRTFASWIVLAAFISAWSATAWADPAFERVDFPAAGGIQVHADAYEAQDSSSALILLFHQAGWSRGEYREIAPKLVDAGYRVMAVDQRSGRGVKGVKNQTHARAKRKKLPTGYLDAYADLQAALRYARDELGATRIVVWGSSYSAALVLRLAAEHPGEVVATMAFSPGEYFDEQSRTYVRDFAKRVQQPLFVTSSKKERAQVKPIFDASPSEKKILFTPASAGQHGSRALWSQWSDSDVYWTAVNGFLEEYAPPKAPN